MRIFMLLLGTAGNALVAFLTHLVLTRHLPVADYGRVVALTAAVTMLVPVASMSIGWFWLELYGREREAAARWGRSARLACLVVLPVSMAALSGYVLLTQAGGDGPFLAACACVMLAGLALAESRAVRLQLEERYFSLALWQVSPQALRSMAVLGIGFAVAFSAQAAVAAYAAAALLTAALSIGSLRTVTGNSLVLPGSPAARPAAVARQLPDVRACLRAAWPFSLVTLFYLVYSTGILALLDPLVGAQASAYYNVGFLIFNSLAMVPSVIYGKYLAGKLFHWWSHDQRKFVAAFHLGVAAHGVLGLVLGALTWLLAPLFVPLLFGEHYHAAVPVVQILAFGVPVRFIQHGYGSVLFSKEHIQRKVRYMGKAAVLSVLLLLVLAPARGAAGAAMAAVGSELALLLFYMYGAARHVAPIRLQATVSPRTLGAAYRELVRPASGGAA